MNQKAKRVVLSALTAVMAAGSLTVATTTQASAINLVSCNSTDFLIVGGHDSIGDKQWNWRNCYANAGEANIDGLGSHWVDYISTGNNRVQWHGDGKWQPDAPINKWTYFVWDNHPGGVRIDKIKIH
ncbi:beta/gamma crystallin domain-containing protein [Streptomyces sp. 3214.6]|uniref:beta/gamma crystallin domain-containing protein n=1 Tax=Streptomyces sp. 3214.6 TaxID=1882757 RepID=UPI00090C6F6B|nr:beta/gamma crystallin domain-containing protein [Streptomyces sp. 3214.6]SHH36680.1 Beta/Gamma crystallin [Streptomyces sp. 3214.6]